MTRPSARHVLPGLTGGTSLGPRTRDPYAKLMEEQIVMPGTPLDDTAANDVTAQFMHLEHKGPDGISLYVNSPGGPFGPMTAVHDTMPHVARDVETVRPGRAGTSAAVPPAAGTPGKRYALPGARTVLRQPALPEPPEGRAGDPVIRAEEQPRARSRPEEMLARHTGRSRERVSADIGHERVLTAQEALEHRLVDRITPGRAAVPAPPAGE
ncbi:ATP-dependent Clp protease proteolytic subunit [Streptomyces sp. NPDC093094]|uniref:ATP-dependent Clp protease proteolytic subunit n=1 Tax=Streptomyces sp. NPDC093094 TaxID=3366026 RepID=UPI00381B424C